LQKLQSIQVLRAVAVIAVIFFHVANFRVGRAGVDLFFCISGYVMAGQMGHSPKQFALDRFTRIYLPFLAALGLLFLAFPMPIERITLIKSPILWPNYHEIYLFPAWSLGYETMFYGACVGAMYFGWRTIIAIFATAFLFRIPYAGSAFVFEFMAGFCIARRNWFAMPLLLLGVASSLDLRVISYGPPAPLVLWTAVQRESLNRNNLWGPIAMLGDASYAIYLMHITISDLLFIHHAPLIAIIYGSITGGVVFHFLIEKPLVKAGRRIASSAPRPRSPTNENHPVIGARQ
jgi:exopolysaccharide production protein ExoZ